MSKTYRATEVRDLFTATRVTQGSNLLQIYESLIILTSGKTLDTRLLKLGNLKHSCYARPDSHHEDYII